MKQMKVERTMEIKSFRNRRWRLPEADAKNIRDLEKKGAGSVIAPILSSRGVTPETLGDFMNPTLRKFLPNPFSFKDMEKAARRLASAIMNSEKIGIWSDYDVDGATSGATLIRFLRETGVKDENWTIHIPDRIIEGYGPNAEGLLAMRDAGFNLIYNLDSGTTAFEPIGAATEAGMEVVIIDHHMAEDTLPNALAVVNPNRADEQDGYGHICAAGMTFLLIIATNMVLRDAGWYGREGAPESAPDMMKFLDLVALGTVCDVVPLKGINRAFVTQGLKYLSARALPGIRALAAKAHCEDVIDAGACGFALGPRINAGGRIGKADTGVLLLVCEDADDADAMADELCRLNEGRQNLEKTATQSALDQFRDFIPGETRKVAVAVVEGHEGVVGISASRLKEALDAPSFVLTLTEDGVLKGSGRSVSGFDMGSAVIAARQAGVIIKGGGHGMAAGVTLSPEKLDDFRAFLNEYISQSDYARNGVEVRADLTTNVGKATVGMCDAMKSLAPFGMGNPTPKIVLEKVEIRKVRIMKNRHIKIDMMDPDMREAGPTLDGVIWNAVDTPFGDALQNSEGMVIDVLGSLDINEWQGRRRVQMKVEDARPSKA